jgi:tetratricopeptide (TPR) repeat protein
MFRSLGRFRAAALPAALTAVLLAGRTPAGPVPSIGTPAAKIKEIEDAGAALQRGHLDDAYKHLQEAVKKNPNLPPARLMLARLLLATREGQQQGHIVLEQAAAENLDHPEVFLTLGSLALAEGRLSETLLDCQKALDLCAADRWTADQKKNFQGQARTGMAAAYENRRDWAGARTHLAALLDLDPKNGPLRQRLARALFFLDKPDDAYAELQEAVKIDSSLEPATVGMGRLWTSKGDFTKAREWLEKAIKSEPNSLRVQLAYADWLLQQNEITQAKARADDASKLRPDDVDVLKLQSLIARIQRDFATAEKILRRVLVDAPNDFFAHNHLALVLADQSDIEQRKRAVQYAEMNARANTRSPEAAATLGYVLYRNGNMNGALQMLQSAVSLAGGQASSDTAYYLALVLADGDKAEDAKKLLKTALDSKGLFVYRNEAKTLYDRLEKKEASKDGKEGKAKENKEAKGDKPPPKP